MIKGVLFVIIKTNSKDMKIIYKLNRHLDSLETSILPVKPEYENKDIAFVRSQRNADFGLKDGTRNNEETTILLRI